MYMQRTVDIGVDEDIRVYKPKANITLISTAPTLWETNQVARLLRNLQKSLYNLLHMQPAMSRAETNINQSDCLPNRLWWIISSHGQDIPSYRSISTWLIIIVEVDEDQWKLERCLLDRLIWGWMAGIGDEAHWWVTKLNSFPECWGGSTPEFGDAPEEASLTRGETVDVQCRKQALCPWAECRESKACPY